MKKLFLCLSLIVTVEIALSQIRRDPPVTDSSQTGMGAQQKITKKEMLDELDLTKDQRIQLKSIRQNNKQQRDMIANNDSLSAEQKKFELKQLRKQTESDINSILTDQQREKYNELKQEMRDQKMSNHSDSLQNKSADEYTPLN